MPALARGLEPRLHGVRPAPGRPGAVAVHERRDPFLSAAAGVVIETMAEAYPILVERREAVLAAIEREETQFARTLDAGTTQLESALAAVAPGAERVIGRRAEELPDGAPLL